jgi:hypothetical protein
VEGPS